MALHKITPKNKSVVLIAATTSAVAAAGDATDIEYELLPDCQYTFVASTGMATGEYVKCEIYDNSKAAFQKFNFGGSEFILEAGCEVVNVRDTAGVLRITKTATVASVGASVTYTGGN